MQDYTSNEDIENVSAVGKDKRLAIGCELTLYFEMRHFRG
jgi:hypothetical protein